MRIKSVFKSFVVISFLLTLTAFIGLPRQEKFQVDTAASTLTWNAKKVTGEHFGIVQIASGELVTDGKIIKQGSFEIDLSTLTVTDVTNAESNAKLVGHLKSDDFFSVAKHPKANFSITSVTPKTGDEYAVKGKLTIKGITNEIEFPATIIRNGKKITASAKIVVDRTQYDIRYRSSNYFENLGDKAISNEFELNLKLVAGIQTGV